MGRTLERRTGAFGACGWVIFLAPVVVLLLVGCGSKKHASIAPTTKTPSFAIPRNYTPGGLGGVALGDLNGDGKPDLAIANSSADTVSVLLNRGDGSFQAKREYRTGRGPGGVAIGDLNGDGKPDLAVTKLGPSAAIIVSVLLNRGDGSFRASSRRHYAIGKDAGQVALGDLNSDGKPDLAIGNSPGDVPSTVSVLLNRGGGSFQAKRDYRTGGGPWSVAIGDLNSDGKPDLVTGDSIAGTVSVLLNRGGGSFPARRDYAVADGAVAIGDLNGDGKPDLAIASFDAGFVSVLVNRGDGSFAAKRPGDSNGNGLHPMSVAIGDLNGDGKPDLAIANSGESDPKTGTDPGSVSVLLNRGDGSFPAELDYRTGEYPASIAIDDLNGDGKPDLVIANSGTNTVSVVLNMTGLCGVPKVGGTTLPGARRAIGRAHCLTIFQ